MNPRFLTARQVRTRFGGISEMTLWRWIHDAKVGFPSPVYINRNRYFDLTEIEQFEVQVAARRVAA
ncbi:helix-turn-helix transcriptional regulator [Paradevosia shaoguanensis]|uniref:helix-turn-helix transcriptional regulator n=1 Tax=Paradevosia shaoguanensis TaxID=1335043 RepID=UPI003C714EBF